MEIKKFVYYKEEDMWIGWLEEFPDYRTQGQTLEELRENLRDIHSEITNDNIPHIRHTGELEVA